VEGTLRKRDWAKEEREDKQIKVAARTKILRQWNGCILIRIIVVMVSIATGMPTPL
jgi:hypothetical protein